MSDPGLSSRACYQTYAHELEFSHMLHSLRTCTVHAHDIRACGDRDAPGLSPMRGGFSGGGAQRQSLINIDARCLSTLFLSRRVASDCQTPYPASISMSFIQLASCPRLSRSVVFITDFCLASTSV